RDLEGESFAVLELRTAVETDTGNAQNRECHGDDLALLAGRVVAGRLVHSSEFAVWKGGGVEARRLMRIVVVPESDRILRFHVRIYSTIVLKPPCAMRLMSKGMSGGPPIAAISFITLALTRSRCARDLNTM